MPGQHGVQVGCETEFYLLQDFPAAFVRESGQEGRSPFLLPVDDSKYSQSASINAAAGGAMRSLEWLTAELHQIVMSFTEHFGACMHTLQRLWHRWDCV